MNQVMLSGKIDYVSPAILQESIPVDKAVIVTLCKD